MVVYDFGFLHSVSHLDVNLRGGLEVMGQFQMSLDHQNRHTQEDNKNPGKVLCEDIISSST